MTGAYGQSLFHYYGTTDRYDRSIGTIAMTKGYKPTARRQPTVGTYYKPAAAYNSLQPPEQQLEPTTV